MADGSTALILAARLAVEGMVEELIASHADVNAVDELGRLVGAGGGRGLRECLMDPDCLVGMNLQPHFDPISEAHVHITGLNLDLPFHAFFLIVPTSS